LFSFKHFVTIAEYVRKTCSSCFSRTTTKSVGEKHQQVSQSQTFIHNLNFVKVVGTIFA
jgi:hypothetical protein